MKSFDEMLSRAKGFDMSKGMAIMLSGYIKRMLEGKYDDLAEAEFFQKLKEMGMPTKYALEAISYFATAVMDQNFTVDSTFKSVLKEVLMDSGSELSKRLINGDQQMANVKSPGQKMIIRALLELDAETVKKFTDWMNTTTPEERVIILKGMRGFSAGEISKLLELSPEHAKQLLGLLDKPKKKGFLQSFTESVDDYNKKLAERLAKKKKGGPNV